MSKAVSRDIEKTKKEICTIFQAKGQKISIEANKTAAYVVLDINNEILKTVLQTRQVRPQCSTDIREASTKITILQLNEVNGQ